MIFTFPTVRVPRVRFAFVGMHKDLGSLEVPGTE